MNIINKYQRSKNGEFLTYTARRNVLEFSTKVLEKLENLKIYKKVIKVIPKNYFDTFIVKKIYYDLYPFFLKNEINEWNQIKNKKIYQNIIPGLYYNIFKEFDYKAKGVKIIKTNNTNYLNQKSKLAVPKLILKDIIKFLSISNFESLSQQANGKNSLIAVNYIEGIQDGKKSDIYFMNNSELNNNDLLIYFESKYLMNRFNSSQFHIINYLKKNKINYIKIWKYKKKFTLKEIDNLLNFISIYKSNDYFGEFLKIILKDFLKKINFWYSFFYQFNIKIHFDATETGDDVIAKQIALEKVDGLSVGKLRSYIWGNPPYFIGFYPNDIFFTWGKHSESQLLKSFNPINKIFQVGNIYPKTDQIKVNELNNINKYFLNNDIKFKILLLDTNYNLNNSKDTQYHFIDEEFIVNFYYKFLKLTEQNPEIGLIIKSKRNQELDILIKRNNRIKGLKNNANCYIIPDPFQKIVTHYSNLCNICVGLSSIAFPSALLECAINNKRSIFLDYGNIAQFEFELIKNIKQNIIFNDLNKMIKNIIEFKNNSIDYKDLGDWSDILNKIDQFKDNNGSSRASKIISVIHNLFNEGNSKMYILNKISQNF